MVEMPAKKPRRRSYEKSDGGLSFGEIARIIGVSRARAEQICKRALIKARARWAEIYKSDPNPFR